MFLWEGILCGMIYYAGNMLVVCSCYMFLLMCQPFEIGIGTLHSPTPIHIEPPSYGANNPICANTLLTMVSGGMPNIGAG